MSLPKSDASIRNMIEKIREAIARRPISRVTDAKWKVSAVLVPIFLKSGQYHLLFMQRTQRVKDHKGEISFPGGSYEKSDEFLLNTALREAEEEVGLAPCDVEVLGELDDTSIIPTNYVISPFVGLIPYPYDFKLDKWETEELIQIPFKDLCDEKFFSKGTIHAHGREFDTDCYKYGGKVIWGATYKILKQFVEIIAGL